MPGTVRNIVLPAAKPAPVGPDGHPAEPLLKPLIADGRLVKSGGKELALELEKKGYGWIAPAGAAS